MSVLDTAPLNTGVLGSTGAVSAYGGNVVKFSGAITQSLAVALTVGSFTRPVRLVRPMLLNCWLGTRPVRRASGAMFTSQSLGVSLEPRVRHVTSPDGPAVMVVSGQLIPRVRSVFRLRATQVMALVSSNSGTDLSTTPAPSERTVFVPAIERTAYVLRN